jgi:23S rRNA pseudouridine1911/1915/1917 synthase
MREQQPPLAISVSDSEAGRRLDLFLAEATADLTRSRVQKLIEEGLVQVNDLACTDKNYRVRIGDRISYLLPDLKEPSTLPEEIPLDIIFEDHDLLVINKAREMVVHPAPGHSGGTLVNALLHYCHDLSGIGGVMRPGIVHRLDKDTSGLLIVAKNDQAHRSLAAQLKSRKLKREYLALVCGKVKPAVGRIEAPVGRHPQNRKKMAVIAGGREAVTRYRVLKEYRQISLLQLKLETGRTHQIRVHLAQIGYPVVGDFVYGPGGCASLLPEMLFTHALHAYRLSFVHPVSKESLTFSASPPPEFQALLHYLAEKE